MFHPTTANPYLITHNPQHCKDGHGWEWKAFASLCWRANLRGAECHHQEQMEGITLAAGIVGAGWVLEPLHGLCAGPLAVLLHPEEWGEAWEEAGVLALHCTDLSIKCSRVRDVLACNQWRAMLAWNGDLDREHRREDRYMEDSEKGKISKRITEITIL